MQNTNSHNVTNPIGLFDSGVGGLSIWNVLRMQLPNENTIYLADHKNSPYGNKTNDEIIHISEKNTEFLLEQNSKLIIIACNTATTIARSHLQQKYKVPIVGIQPATKPAGLNTKTNKIGVLATARTLKSELFSKTAKNEVPDYVKIFKQSGTGLVELIENNKIKSPETHKLLTKYLEPMLKKQIDFLVLGCTHYPFLIDEINKITQNKITILEPSEAIIRHTKNILKKEGLLQTNTVETHHKLISNKQIEILKKFVVNDKNLTYILQDF